jgi:hypothetical protein
VVVGYVTAAVILLTEVPALLEIPRLGWHSVLVPFAIRYTIKVSVVAFVNCFALALPIAAAIYYLHNVAEDR